MTYEYGHNLAEEEALVFMPYDDLATGVVENNTQNVHWHVPDARGGKFLLAAVAGLGMGAYNLAAHPHAAEAATQPATEVTAPQEGSVEVTVHNGQTVYGIGHKYGTTVADIADFNHLKDPSKLHAGKKILVPVELHTHAVVEGDTLYSLARRYGTTEEAIARINGVNGSKIMKDSNLFIPVIKVSPVDAPRGEAQPKTETKAAAGHVLPAAKVAAEAATTADVTPNKSATAGLNIDAIGTYNGVDPNVTKNVVRYLIEKHGFSPQGAAYFTASGIQESSLRARPAGSNDQGSSHGGWQLHNERAEGLPQDDLYAQIDFIVSVDMQRDKISAQKHVLETLRNPQASPEDVRAAIKNYERYAPGAVGGRFKWGREIYEAMQSATHAAENNTVVTSASEATAVTPEDVPAQNQAEPKVAFSAPQPPAEQPKDTSTTTNNASPEAATQPPADTPAETPAETPPATQNETAPSQSSAEAKDALTIAPLSFEGVNDTARAYLDHAEAVPVNLNNYEQFAAAQDGSVWPRGIDTSKVGVFNKEIAEKSLKGIDHLILHWTGGSEDDGSEIAGSLLGRKGKCCSMQLGMDTSAHTYAFTEDPAIKVAGARGMNDKGHSNNGYSIGIEVAAKGMPGSYVLSNGRTYNGDPNETGYTDEQQQQVVYVMTWLCEKYNLSPDVIVGHEAVSKDGKTDIPPQYAQIIRAKVSALLAARAAHGQAASDGAAAQLASNLGISK